TSATILLPASAADSEQIDATAVETAVTTVGSEVPAGDEAVVLAQAIPADTTTTTPIGSADSSTESTTESPHGDG
ncbi:hypothetical protein BGX29_001917, partial [Mortierella sp. GBA35]